MRAQRSRPCHHLIPVTAVRVVVRIASNGPRNDHGRNRSVHREPLPRETAMGQRQPMACETAAAKTVTSASIWPAPPPQANAIVPVGRCRYAEDDSHSRCDNLLAILPNLLCHLIWIALVKIAVPELLRLDRNCSRVEIFLAPDEPGEHICDARNWHGQSQTDQAFYLLGLLPIGKCPALTASRTRGSLRRRRADDQAERRGDKVR
jgi:hypothetical protein